MTNSVSRVGCIQHERTSTSFFGILIASFFIAIAVFVIDLIVSGIYPFGPESILTEDLKNQYIDFFTWYQSVLRGEKNLFYSFAQSLGNNTWGLFSYYLSSPLNLLIVFFDRAHLVDFVVLITALKLGLASVSMSFFLSKRFSIHKILLLSLSMCYTYSTWMIAQVRNIMWIEALILLPLIAYGIFCFVRKGKWKLLLLCIAAAIICCWYTAYMLIIYSVFLLCLELYLFHSENNSFSKKEVWKTIFQFILIILAALFLCSFTFVPTVIAMLGSLDSSGVSPNRITKGLILIAVAIPLCIFLISVLRTHRISLRTKCILVVGLALLMMTSSFVLPWIGHCSLPQLISSLFFGCPIDSVTPQLFCGSLVLLLVALFFFAHSIPSKTKLAFVVFLFVMIFSVWNDYLYVVWCGFKVPLGFYSRISFLFIFSLILCAAYAAQSLSNGKIVIKELCGGTLSVGVLFFVVLIAGATLPGANPLSVITMMLIEAILLFCFIRAQNTKHTTLSHVSMAILLIVTLGELILLTYTIWQTMYVGYPQEYHDTYVRESRSQQEELQTYDDSWYRQDKTYTRAGAAALNEGISMGFLQLSSYSSANTPAAVNFLNTLGYSQENQISTRYASPILVSDSLLGVSYVSTSSIPPAFEDLNFLTTSQGNTFYHNPYALSLGYRTDEAILDLDLTDYENPFERQNALLSALLGRKVECYKVADSTLIEESGQQKSWEVETPEGAIGSVYVVSSPKTTCMLSIDEGEAFRENWRFQHSIQSFAFSPKEETTHHITLDYTIQEDHEGDLWADCIFYYLDMSTFTDAIKEVEKNQFELETFRDGYIQGTYTADEDGFMLLSIPHDGGWTITVNAEAVDAVPICEGALIAIPVEKGTNQIELSYLSPGFVEGCVLSLFTIFFTIVVTRIGKRPKTQRELNHTSIR